MLRWAGSAALFWLFYSVGDSVRRDYVGRAQEQAENAWLYKHCQENVQLKAHTDACDRVAHLFAVSPLEGALLHPAVSLMHQAWVACWDAYALSVAFIGEHRYSFAALWLLLFMCLPRLFLVHRLKNDERGLEEHLRAAAVISIAQPATFSRPRRRCIV